MLLLDDVDAVEFDCRVLERAGGMPYVWVWGNRFDRVHDALTDDPAVTDAALVDRIESGRLYRVAWDGHVSDLLDAVRTSDGRLRDGRGDDRWTFEIRFETQSDLEAFSERCLTVDLDVRVNGIRSLVDPRDDDYGLTETQRETLLTAESRGYFEEPREVTLETLAHELERSSAAVSGLLRRGLSTLIQNTLADADSEES